MRAFSARPGAVRRVNGPANIGRAMLSTGAPQHGTALSMAKDNIKTPRWGWALTGSGHFFKESLAIMRNLPDLDVFL